MHFYKTFLYTLCISFILGKITLTVLLCIAVNTHSRLSDMTVHMRSRLNDINITEHYSVAFNALKVIDSETVYYKYKFF